MSPAGLCVLVGAGPGLGAALARRFASEGHAVALVARSSERLGVLAEQVREQVPGGVVRGFAGDAADDDSLRSAFASAQEWAGPPRVLLYNAADMRPDERLPSRSALDESFQVTVGGAVTSVDAVTESMSSAGGGTILITGGGLALEPYPHWASLAAGKAALRSLALSWHKQLRENEIHVAVVAVCGIVEPGGPFDPDLVAEQYWQLHRQPLTRAQREVVLLPEGADPFYNDPSGRYRDVSQPIRALPVGTAPRPPADPW